MIEEESILPKYLDTEYTDAPQQVKVSQISAAYCNLTAFNRRDFYKVTLNLGGNSELFYANRAISINKPALVFTNPQIPYSWEGDHQFAEGYFCVFTDNFLQGAGRSVSLDELNLFKPNGDPVYFLNDEQADYLYNTFVRMQQELESDYVYKYDLVRNHLNLIIHEAIKMQPALAFTPQKASSRIANLFLTLLSKQFPVDSPQYALQLKKASDYADRLAVHVNHLNAAVREITGKSTTTHINERILAEAKSLLTHTDWSVAEIAACLGFDYSSYFNNFYKKHTGSTPLALRKNL